MHNFYIGQVVQLNSGGASMTVTQNRADQVVTAEWTDEEQVPHIIHAPQECFFAVQK